VGDKIVETRKDFIEPRDIVQFQEWCNQAVAYTDIGLLAGLNVDASGMTKLRKKGPGALRLKRLLLYAIVFAVALGLSVLV